MEVFNLRQLPREEYLNRLGNVVDVFIDSLEHTPPFEGAGIHRGLTEQRFREQAQRPGASAFFTEDRGTLAAVGLYETYPSLEELEAAQAEMPDFSRAIAFLKTLQEPSQKAIWENWIFTSPAYQRRGLATALRQYSLDTLLQTHGRALVLTCHAVTNQNVIKSSQSLGFQHTGVTYTQDQTPILEYWYQQLSV